MTGPNEGSRKAMTADWSSWRKASPRPTVTVDLPSPAGVGLIEVTKMSLPSSFSFNRLMA